MVQLLTQPALTFPHEAEASEGGPHEAKMVQIWGHLALSFTTACFVAPDKSLNLPEPQFTQQ